MPAHAAPPGTLVHRAGPCFTPCRGSGPATLHTLRWPPSLGHMGQQPGSDRFLCSLWLSCFLSHTSGSGVGAGGNKTLALLRAEL